VNPTSADRSDGPSVIRPSERSEYGRHPRSLGGGYREAAARASARAAESEPRSHCVSGKDFGVTAVLGDAKFNVALPPKFNPAEDTWMLWKPLVFS
jgi:hypothetical protein